MSKIDDYFHISDIVKVATTRNGFLINCTVEIKRGDKYYCFELTGVATRELTADVLSAAVKALVFDGDKVCCDHYYKVENVTHRKGASTADVQRYVLCGSQPLTEHPDKTFTYVRLPKNARPYEFVNLVYTQGRMGALK